MNRLAQKLTVGEIRKLNALSKKLGFFSQIRTRTLVTLPLSANLDVSYFVHQTNMFDAPPNLRCVVSFKDGGGGYFDLPLEMAEKLTSKSH